MKRSETLFLVVLNDRRFFGEMFEEYEVCEGEGEGHVEVCMYGQSSVDMMLLSGKLMISPGEEVG